ncbi:hypothetical protein AAHA92_09815 [Salvia divinorum]|uniref:Uncharacterized protein n=1 Tax=Salvia divinorum TaxID=28513 RepID=A0ABD1HW54_SALDI
MRDSSYFRIKHIQASNKRGRRKEKTVRARGDFVQGLHIANILFHHSSSCSQFGGTTLSTAATTTRLELFQQTTVAVDIWDLTRRGKQTGLLGGAIPRIEQGRWTCRTTDPTAAASGD